VVKGKGISPTCELARMFDFALVTCSDYPDLHPEDALLKQALESVGLSSRARIWDDPNAPNPAKGWLMRTAWDYTAKSQEFLKWLKTLPAERCWNSPGLMAWNVHKRYVLDLESCGCAVVPTELFYRGSKPKLASRSGRWVAKPAISAGSRGALHGQWSEIEPHLQHLLELHDVLLQPYYDGVETYKERSLIFVDGQFQHAVTRTVALLEGRGVDRIHPRAEPTSAEMACAQKVVASLKEVPLYARVDLIPDPQANPVLLELEVIEPQLFLLEAPETAQAIATALLRRLG
jgi:hypothetical protein